MDRLVAAYFVYNALSFIWLIRSGLPVYVYTGEFPLSLLPVICYYAGRNLSFKRDKDMGKLGIVAMLAGLFVTFECLLLYRQQSVSELFDIGSRAEHFIAAVNNMYSTWLGNGLGANGQLAIGLEDAIPVTDGGLIKSYCEQGIFGFSMFIYILILTFKKGMGEIGKYGIELGMITAVLLFSVGNVILSYPLAAVIFWFAIGSVQSEKTTLNKDGIKETEKTGEEM